MKAPIVLIVFNRPELTRRVFDRVAKARPESLFVIADGPRNREDAARCAEVRSIVTAVDWPCELVTDFSPTNLGCWRRFVSGLTIVFSRVEYAIILEDDCLPDPTFFAYCETLLERFRYCDRVMEIGGANYQSASDQTGTGFYFSRYSHTHGWATWRRAWELFDEDLAVWPSLRKSGFLSKFFGPVQSMYLCEIFDSMYAGEIMEWDYQWQLAMWLNGGLSAVPNSNLISNIGFGRDATHTIDRNHPFAELPLQPLRAIGKTPPFSADDRLDCRELSRVGHAGIVATLRQVVRGRIRRFLRKTMR